MTTDANRIDEVLAEFMQHLDRGEDVQPEELLAKHPDLADELLAYFEGCDELDRLITPPGLSGRGSDTFRQVRVGPPAEVAPAGYDLLEELGHGGMGVVYKAWQRGLSRVVALKMLLSATDGAADRLRFRAEAEAVAHLRHPNIVQIFEVDEVAGRPFFSQEFLEGGTLSGRLSGSPWPAVPAAQMIECLARAIQHAHDRGVIHRDLKPSNVLLTADGVPKIADFGLAKRLDVPSDLTRTGAILGTPNYMAPEQASGEGASAGPPADIYALGTILYEMLTGRPPFAGPTPLDTLLQVKFEEPVPPTRLQPKVPPDLETICLKCLEKAPQRRYVSASALADDLQRFVRGEPIHARAISSLERGLKWVRRRPLPATLVATTFLAVILGVAGITWKWQEALAAQANEAEQKSAAQKLTIKTQGLLETSDADRYRMRVLLADRERLANRVPRAEELLDACPPDRRQWEWFYLKRQCHTDLQTFQIGGGCKAFSADGLRFVVGGEEGMVKTWDVLTGQELCSFRAFDRAITSIALSSDGRLLAAGAEDGTVRLFAFSGTSVPLSVRPAAGWKASAVSVRLLVFRPDDQRLSTIDDHNVVTGWQVNGGTAVFTREETGSRGMAVAYRPDGKQLAIGCRDRKVRLYDAETGELQQTLEGHRGIVFGVAFDRDGHFLASVSSDGTARVWDVRTGAERAVLDGQAGYLRGVAFSPDGTRLATAGQSNIVIVWDWAGGKEWSRLRGHRWSVLQLAFLPDGRRLASADEAKNLKVWDVTSPPEAHVFAAPNPVRAIDVAPDGTTVAAALGERGRPGSVRLIDAYTGAAKSILARGESAYTSLAYSPDGERLAAGCEDRTVRVWDVATGTERLRLEGHTGPVWAVAYSPDNRLLASASEDHTVRLWDVASGKEVRCLPSHAEPVVSLAFHPKGRQLATGSLSVDRAAGSSGPRPNTWHGTVRIWDIVTGTELATLPGAVGAVAYDRIGKRLATGAQNGTVKLWDAATNQEILTILQTRRVRALAFSPDGQRLAGASVDRSAKLWDVVSGQEVLTPREHAIQVTGVAFTPDGQRLITASHDHLIKIWDASPVRDRDTTSELPDEEP